MAHDSYHIIREDKNLKNNRQQNGFFLLHALTCTCFLAASTALLISFHAFCLEDRAHDLKMTAYHLAKREILLAQAAFAHETETEPLKYNSEYKLNLNECIFTIKRNIDQSYPALITVQITYPLQGKEHSVRLEKYVCNKNNTT